MQIPAETVTACFPPSFTAGNIVLRPLTLGDAVRLGSIGVDVNRRIPADKLFSVAFVISGEAVSSPLHAHNGEAVSSPLQLKAYRRFLRRARVGLQELSSAIEKALNAAFETWIPPMEQKGATRQLTPSGLGWPLEYAEWLCAEYGWSFDRALETPVATVFALVAAARKRNDGKHGGPDYVERVVVKNMTH